MAEQILIILGRWVVPVQTDQQHRRPNLSFRGEDLVISHGAVAVRNGIIVDVGKSENVVLKYSSDTVEIVDLSERHIIIPGLINCHTHCAMSLLRGYADDLPLKVWLERYIWPTEGRLMSDEYIYEGTSIALVEAIQSGTTMINDMYFLPESSLRAFGDAGIRCVTGSAFLDFKDGTMEQKFHSSIDFIKKYMQKKDKLDFSLVRPSFAPHSLYTVEEFWHVRGTEELNSGELKDSHIVYHTHLHETEAERHTYETRTGKTALQSLYDAGALSERFVGAHCVHLTDEEINLLARTKANVCHCPKCALLIIYPFRSNLKLASGFCQAWQLIQSGINVCLGTDGGCSNNSLDMLSEMQYAALLAKAVSKNSCAVDAYTALKMATRNGARALGRLHDLGSLEVGKLADIVAVDLIGNGDFGYPIYDPISSLVYTTHRKVTDMWVNGKRIMCNSQILTIKLDTKRLDKLVEKISEIRNDINASSTENVLKVFTPLN